MAMIEQNVRSVCIHVCTLLPRAQARLLYAEQLLRAGALEKRVHVLKFARAPRRALALFSGQSLERLGLV